MKINQLECQGQLDLVNANWEGFAIAKMWLRDPVRYQSKIDEALEDPILNNLAGWAVTVIRALEDPLMKEFKAFAKQHNVNVEGDRKTSLAMYVTLLDRPKLLAVLLDQGADPYRVSAFSNTLLSESARTNDLKNVDYLLKKLPNIVKNDPQGAAHAARAFIGNKRVKHLNALLRQGLDVESQDRYGDTLLMRAGYLGCLKCIDALIHSGAHVEYQNHQGWSILHETISNGRDRYLTVKHCLKYPEMLGLLDLRTGGGETPFLSAVKSDRRDVVELLIKKGADIHVQNNRGWNATILAIQEKSLELLERLIELGVSVDHIDYSELSVVDHARLRHFKEGEAIVNAVLQKQELNRLISASITSKVADTKRRRL